MDDDEHHLFSSVLAEALWPLFVLCAQKYAQSEETENHIPSLSSGGGHFSPPLSSHPICPPSGPLSSGHCCSCQPQQPPGHCWTQNSSVSHHHPGPLRVVPVSTSTQLAQACCRPPGLLTPEPREMMQPQGVTVGKVLRNPPNQSPSLPGGAIDVQRDFSGLLKATWWTHDPARTESWSYNFSPSSLSSTPCSFQLILTF